MALALGSGRASAQTAGRAGYGALVPDPRGMLDLPEGFRYRVISREGQKLSDGTPVPGDHDGMVAIAGRGDNTILVRNHELRTADANPLEGKNPYDPSQVGGTTAVVVRSSSQVSQVPHGVPPPAQLLTDPEEVT